MSSYVYERRGKIKAHSRIHTTINLPDQQHNGFFNRYRVGAIKTASKIFRNPGMASPFETYEKSANSRQTESLFHTYSQFSNVPNIPVKPSEDERQTESKLQDILDRVCKSAIYPSSIY